MAQVRSQSIVLREQVTLNIILSLLHLRNSKHRWFIITTH